LVFAEIQEQQQPPISQDEQNEHIFKLLDRDPNAWLNQATDLKTSANVILERLREAQEPTANRTAMQPFLRSFTQSYMLLAGLAVENLIKSKWYASNPTRAVRGHALLELANQVVPDLSADEADVLERLEVYVRWAGRYPTPTNLAAFQASVSAKPMSRLTFK